MKKSFHLNTKLENLVIEVHEIKTESSLWNLLGLFPKLKRLMISVEKCQEQFEDSSHFQILSQMKDLKEKRLRMNYFTDDRAKEFKEKYLDEQKSYMF